MLVVAEELRQAVMDGNCYLVERALACAKPYNLDLPDSKGYTVLMNAVLGGQSVTAALTAPLPPLSPVSSALTAPLPPLSPVWHTDRTAGPLLSVACGPHRPLFLPCLAH